MAVVVQLNARRKPAQTPALEQIDRALSAEFLRLAQRHGYAPVITAATKIVAEVMAMVHARHRPVDDRWLANLARAINEALEDKP